MGELLRRTGILDELDADVDRPAATQRARNLAAFLDQVHAFEPIEGELTLRVFLDYIDDVIALEREDWETVQPSDEDAVKIMTIHQAKGLEFDHVFVPGVATGLMPSKRIQQNPAERGYSLDFELRGDAAVLPTFDGVLSHFKTDLQRQEVIEERRTMYVALTRARRTLWVSAATWYGELINAKGASGFFQELRAWGEETGDAELEIAEDDGTDDEQNPMLGYRLERVRDWPGPARREEADEAFPLGWRTAAAEAVASGGVQTQLVDALVGDDRLAYDALTADQRQLAAHLVERESEDGSETGPRIPTVLSASALVDYARCPKRFYWTAVRPLPRFSGPAARIGTEIHRWIERRASGQGQLVEIDDPVDLTQEELAGDPGRVERLREAFLVSRYADAVPLFAERAFLLRAGAFTVGGRIDAIYGDVDGPWEVVDWKTGTGVADPLQLDLYGLACTEIWGKRPEDVTLTYFYLAKGEAVSRPMDEPVEVRSRLEDRSHRSKPEPSTPRRGPGARSATSGGSATRARRGSPRTGELSPVDERRSGPSAPRTADSSPPGRSRPPPVPPRRGHRVRPPSGCDRTRPPGTTRGHPAGGSPCRSRPAAGTWHRRRRPVCGGTRARSPRAHRRRRPSR